MIEDWVRFGAIGIWILIVEGFCGLIIKIHQVYFQNG